MTPEPRPARWYAIAPPLTPRPRRAWTAPLWPHFARQGSCCAHLLNDLLLLSPVLFVRTAFSNGGFDAGGGKLDRHCRQLATHFGPHQPRPANVAVLHGS